MKIELTEQQYRYLLDLVYIGNWVVNSTRGDDRIKEYDQVESLVFSHCLRNKMSRLVELYQGELIPSRRFADGGIHEAIEQYEDIIFYEILAEELDVPILSVGGYRSREKMEAVLRETKVEMISLCRPLICEPDLPNRLESGMQDKANCYSCLDLRCKKIYGGECLYQRMKRLNKI